MIANQLVFSAISPDGMGHAIRDRDAEAKSAVIFANGLLLSSQLDPRGEYSVRIPDLLAEGHDDIKHVVSESFLASGWMTAQFVGNVLRLAVNPSQRPIDPCRGRDGENHP